MVEPDAKSPRSDRDEAAMDAARHAAGGMSFDDFKSLIEQEGLWVNDAAAQSAWGRWAKASLRLTNWMNLLPSAKESSFPSFFPASTV